MATAVVDDDKNNEVVAESGLLSSLTRNVTTSTYTTGVKRNDLGIVAGRLTNGSTDIDAMNDRKSLCEALHDPARLQWDQQHTSLVTAASAGAPAASLSVTAQ